MAIYFHGILTSNPKYDIIYLGIIFEIPVSNNYKCYTFIIKEQILWLISLRFSAATFSTRL